MGDSEQLSMDTTRERKFFQTIIGMTLIFLECYYKSYPKLLNSSDGCFAVIPNFYHGNCYGLIEHHINQIDLKTKIRKLKLFKS